MKSKTLQSFTSLSSLQYILLFFFLIGIPSFLSAQNPPKRYIVHGLLNLDPGVNHGIVAMDKMVNAGCNAVALTIMWDRIYPKADSKPYWTQIDNQINHITNDLKVKLIIRIHLGRHIALTSGFWSADDAIQDFKGKPLTVYYDNNHFSFAHQPSINKAEAFVKEVCERYKTLQRNGQILFVSVVNTPQQELGYAYDNQQFPNPSYPAVYDHSKWAMINLRDWAKEKYQTIRTLNSYWGTTYKNFSEVEPYVNWGNTRDSFRGRRGKDWYVVRHLLLKKYIDQITTTIKGVDANYRVACEFGGVADNLSFLRGTYAFKTLSENVDIIKTSVDAFQGEGFQGDIVYSNLKPNQKFYTEVAHFDQPTAEALRSYVIRSIEYGCEVIMLYVDYDNGKEIEKILPAVYEGVKWIDKANPPVVFADSVKYRLSQLIDNREAAIEDWKIRSDFGRKKVKITYEEDLLLEKQKIDNPLPDIVETTPTPTNPPPPPPKRDGPNEAPRESFKDYTKEVVLNQGFIFRIPDNLYYDPDGFIAYIEVLEAPIWISFNKFEFTLFGRAPSLGKSKVRLKVYDNNGESIESIIYVQSVPPIIDFELIKADYFDVPIEGWGFINDKRIIYLEGLPEKLNIIARCNLDSVKFVFDLNGPYRFNGISERLPYNVFGEGRGIKFPIGTYSLSARAYHRDSIITQKTIQFTVKASINPASGALPEWQVYPNPFENICNVKLPDNEDFTTMSFTVVNIRGHRIKVKEEVISVVEKTAYIDLDRVGIANGNYILEISRGSEILKRIKVSKL